MVEVGVAVAVTVVGVGVEVGVNVGVGVDVCALTSCGIRIKQTPRKISIKEKMDRIFLLINKKCKQIFFKLQEGK